MGIYGTNTEHFNTWWETTLGHDATSTTKIKCRECNEWSLVSRWAECEVACDLCGEHDGIRCPECEESFDHVWGAEKPFEAREP